MQGRFDRWDRAANGVLFALYHLHVPWVIPRPCSTGSSRPTRPGVRRALVGIAVHSARSVIFAALVLALVFR